MSLRTASMKPVTQEPHQARAVRTYPWRDARCVLIVMCLALSSVAGADEWARQRPLRLIVPFPPGGTADLLARMLAPPMGAALGQPRRQACADDSNPISSFSVGNRK